MKPLILSTADINGGAARAAYRLHQGLQSIDVSSQMLVQTKTSDDVTVISPRSKIDKGIAKLRLTLDRLPLLAYKKSEREIYSLQWLPERVAAKVAQIDPDVINLHWVCHGFLNIETLTKFTQPIVWTLHDMWAFTGGCHYNQECDRYIDSYGACPQLSSSSNHDLSHWVWQRKAKAWKNINLTIVTPSKWLAKCVSSSSLFKDLRIEVIPNGLDTDRYKPMNRQLARQLLGLPEDKLLVLFGAMNATSDPRKGFHLLQQALLSLSKSEWKEQLSLVVMGASQPSSQLDFGFKTHYLGKLSDDISLALIYAAADVFVAPSIQDNLPNTVMEALSCGTPCVAFNIGGMPDMIEHQRNGYLAQAYKTEDLAQGIAWVLVNLERHSKLCKIAREKAECEFTSAIQAQRYTSIFTEISPS
jgi:glycosyltransferase involved in cell wall biosynthesis